MTVLTTGQLTKDSTFQDMLNVLNTIPVNPKNGATGNAQPNQVLQGITFSNVDGNDKVGTMPNKSNLTNQTIARQNGEHTIAEGYYNGTTKVIANFANCVAGNIKNGVDIGGIIGNLKPAYYASLNCGQIAIPDNLVYSVTNLSFKPRMVIMMYASSGKNYVRVMFDDTTIDNTRGYNQVEFNATQGYPNMRPYTTWGGNDFGSNNYSITLTNNGFTARNINRSQNKAIIVSWVAMG